MNADHARQIDQSVRPVERPQDREWTEWVYLLKRLATKRRIPARVLYNGQIKQFVTILENSLESRYSGNWIFLISNRSQRINMTYTET
jgi:hypothetical protein